MTRVVIASHAEPVRSTAPKTTSSPQSSTQDPVCGHEWIDARNPVVVSGSYCGKCGLLSADNASHAKPPRSGAPTPQNPKRSEDIRPSAGEEDQ
jgi:hypothetical protein